MLEAGPVEGFELDLLVARSIVMLQDDHLEHEHRVEGRTAAQLRNPRRDQILELRAEDFEIDGFPELIQWGNYFPGTPATFEMGKKPSNLGEIGSGHRLDPF